MNIKSLTALPLMLMAFSFFVLLSYSASEAQSVSLPELPRIYIDTTFSLPTGGTTYRPTNPTEFQAALNSSKLGDVIELQAGTTYAGNFTLPNKTTGSGWIYIISSAYSQLPLPGSRISPSNASLMPKIVTNALEPAITTQAGAHHYRFVGVEIKATLSDIYGIVTLGTGSHSSSQLPNNIVFDRVWIHGSPSMNVQNSLIMNSSYTSLIDSYVDDSHYIGTESHAIVGWNGPGPFKIVNNELQGAGINILFGGADPSIAGLVPSDIEIRKNHFFKPLTWKPDEPTYGGQHWSVKNLLEIKQGKRLSIDGNIFENSWADAQEGWAVRFVLGSDLYADISDITFTNNIVRHAAYGLDICGNCSTAAYVIRDVLIQNNLFYDITANRWSPGYGGAGWALMYRSGAQNIQTIHNTFDNAGTFVVFTGNAGSGLVMKENIANHGSYGVNGDGGYAGTAALDHYFPGWAFQENVLAGTPSGNQSLYPATTLFPSSMSDVGFVNYSAGDYHLTLSSSYKNAGTDGKDIGADIDALQAAAACVISGACGTSPIPDAIPPAAPTGLKLR